MMAAALFILAGYAMVPILVVIMKSLAEQSLHDYNRGGNMLTEVEII